MQYAIFLSFQSPGPDFVFKFLRLNPTWSTYVPISHKFSNPTASDSSKPWNLSSPMVLSWNSSSSTTYFFFGGEIILPTYTLERESLIIFYTFLFNHSFINRLHNLFMLFETESHSVAQDGLKFTTVLLPQLFKYWEYSLEPLHPYFLHNVTCWYMEMLLNKSKLLKQIQFMLKTHLL